MENLTLSQATKFIENCANEALRDYNTKHPENIITREDSFKCGYLETRFAFILSNFDTIESFINDNKNCLPMDITKNE
jgi:hypothetical protein